MLVQNELRIVVGVASSECVVGFAAAQQHNAPRLDIIRTGIHADEVGHKGTESSSRG